jgi:phage tail tape-measure protein
MKSPVIKWIVFVGATVVGIATAAVSSVTLYSLAVHISVPDVNGLPAALPIALDMGATVAALVWITSEVGSELRRWAKGLALGSLAATVIGNALEHAITGGFISVDLWITVGVGALIPTSLFSIFHLLALIFHPEASKPQKKAEAKKVLASPKKVTAETKQHDTNEFQDKQVSSAQMKEWIRSQLDAGNIVTGRDVDNHFKSKSRNGSRLVASVLKERGIAS